MRNKRERITARTASRSLRAEIEDLEKRLGMSYMDDEVFEDIDDEVEVEDMAYMDDTDTGMDEMNWMDEDISVVEPDIIDEELLEEQVDGCGDFMASEVDPNGVEEQITQDYLDAVEEVAHGKELATAPSMGKVAPTKSTYVASLKRASARLDRVAGYLEGQGRKDLALRIDKIADAVDERINSMRRA